LIKSSVGEAFDPLASEKLAKSSGGILRLYPLAFMVSSGSLGWLFR
jgi:hypothetical protein